MSKSKNAAATSATSVPLSSGESSAATQTQNGTLHVKVLRARNLPRMDFGKRQDPFGASK